MKITVVLVADEHAHRTGFSEEFDVRVCHNNTDGAAKAVDLSRSGKVFAVVYDSRHCRATLPILRKLDRRTRLIAYPHNPQQLASPAKMYEVLGLKRPTEQPENGKVIPMKPQVKPRTWTDEERQALVAARNEAAGDMAKLFEGYLDRLGPDSLPRTMGDIRQELERLQDGDKVAMRRRQRLIRATFADVMAEYADLDFDSLYPRVREEIECSRQEAQEAYGYLVAERQQTIDSLNRSTAIITQMQEKMKRIEKAATILLEEVTAPISQ